MSSLIEPAGGRFTYAYDAAGQRTQVVEASGDVTTWAYDNTYQLTRERRSGLDGYNVTYSYDPAGNRLLKIDSAARTTLTYDAASRLFTEDEAAGATTFTYDDAGNRRSKEEPAGDLTTMTWDYENMSTSVELPSNAITTYTYNGDDQRISKEDSTGETDFLFDAQSILAEYDGLGAVQALYTHLPDEFGTLVAQHRGGDSSFYHFDALGSTAALTDDAEVITDTYVYYAFGAENASSGTTDNPFRWVGAQGYYQESTLGLYNLRARDYDPAAGLFVSEDPIGFDSGDANFYRYVSNNSINRTDAAGLGVGPLDILNNILDLVGLDPIPLTAPEILTASQMTSMLLEQAATEVRATPPSGTGFQYLAAQFVVAPAIDVAAGGPAVWGELANLQIIADQGGDLLLPAVAFGLSTIANSEIGQFAIDPEQYVVDILQVGWPLELQLGPSNNQLFLQDVGEFATSLDGPSAYFGAQAAPLFDFTISVGASIMGAAASSAARTGGVLRRPRRLRTRQTRTKPAGSRARRSAATMKATTPNATRARRPAAARMPIDSSRKIHGAKRHDATAFNVTKRWQGDPATVQSRFNQQLVDADGNAVPGLQPDAQRMRLLSDGSRVVDIVEVKSASQSRQFMDNKIQRYLQVLGEQAGDVRWIVPTDPARQ